MRIKIENPLVGADPEVFLVSKETGKFISAIGRLGGTKIAPRALGNGFFVQEDNVLAEFNIPPAKNKKEFTKHIQTGLKLLTKEVNSFANLAIKPYAFFDRSELKTPKARHFGCSPDMSCWTLRTNPSPEAVNKTLRTAAGHITLGYDNNTTHISQRLAQAFDLFIGTPSTKISMDEKPRRELYGKMGTIRFTAFGVEYRTPSNFWLVSPDRCNWVYEQVMRGIEFVEEEKQMDEEDFLIMEMAINEGEVEASEYLIEKHKINLVE